MSAVDRKPPALKRGGMKRGLAGGVRREVGVEERATLAELRPDARTQALLDTLAPAVATAAVSQASERVEPPADAPVAAPTRTDRPARPASNSSGRSLRAKVDAPTSTAIPTEQSTGDRTSDSPAPTDSPREVSASEDAQRAASAPGAAKAASHRVAEAIPVEDVAPSPHQARRFFGDIDGLAQSILETGLQHPILVRRNPAGAATPYVLVFGERRHRAFGRLQGHEDVAVRSLHRAIPAFVLEPHELSDARLAVLTAEENAQRAQLTAWELARNVVGLKAVLDAEEGRSITFEQLGRHFNLQAGSTNEYYTIGAAFPDQVLREAGLARGDDMDWERVAALRKQRLLSIAKKPPDERVALLRAYAGLDGRRRTRGSGPRFTVDQLRTQGGFTLKIEKPVTSASYTRTQGESFLRDLEPALALLAEVAGEGRAAFRPSAPNLPGTYLVLRDRPGRLTQDERRQALALLDELREELSTSS